MKSNMIRFGQMVLAMLISLVCAGFATAQDGALQPVPPLLSTASQVIEPATFSQETDVRSPIENSPRPVFGAPPSAQPSLSAPVYLQRLPFIQAVNQMGVPLSSQHNRDNAHNRQRAVARPNNAVLDPATEGITIFFAAPSIAPRELAPLAIPPATLTGPGLGNMLFNVTGSTFSSVIIDTTRLGPNSIISGGFAPAVIAPQPATGERANLVASNIESHIALTGLANTDIAAAKLYTDFQTITLANGQTTVQFRHIYGQFGNVVAGSTDSFFADPDAIPNTLDSAGPNSQIYKQHPLLGYIIPFSVSDEVSYYAGISAEVPEINVAAPETISDPNSYSHAPDFAVKARYENKSWGHIQLSGIMRDIAFENKANTFHRDAFGWGANLSIGVRPFQGFSACEDDVVSLSAKYGEGISSYILDLEVANAGDAAFDSSNHLVALPAFAGFFGYTHFWSSKLNSTIVYSQVELDSGTSNMPSFYRRGRYVAANVVYEWNVLFPDAQGQLKGHTAIVGLEYLYGKFDTLGNGSGEDHRAQATVGLKF
jgi:hypothetical protein